MSRAGTVDAGTAPEYSHLYSWFHYMFNMQYAKRPLKYPEKLIDTCITLFKEKRLNDDFMHKIGFCEIDWVFALNRAMRQSPHRFFEAKECIREFANEFIDFFESLDFETHERANDLHMLFGATCALAEIQAALPGEVITDKPLKLVLNRRPFI